MSANDTRTLCDSCRAKYQDAGFELIKVWVKYKEECDVCRVKMGWSFKVRERNHLRSSDGKSAEFSQISMSRVRVSPKMK